MPFDIAHLRCVEYENTATGLKELAGRLKTYFEHFRLNPGHPDNQLQELAKLTGYQFPDYGSHKETAEVETEAFMAMLRSPEILDLMVRQTQGEEVGQAELMRAMLSAPEAAEALVRTMVQSGQLSLHGEEPTSKDTSRRKTTPAKVKRKKKRSR